MERFEDLEIWKKARELCKLIHIYTEHDRFSRDFKLVGQIKGSSGSVMVKLLPNLKKTDF